MGIKPASLAAVSAALLLAACEQENVYAPPPPPEVSVALPVEQDVTEYLEFTGTTAAVEAVEIRARIPGFLDRMVFRPGTRVDAGELLFVIDPREYEAELRAAKAELESARTQLQRAATEVDRADKLFRQNAGSEFDLVKWKAERDVSEAAVARAQAKVERAELDLSYTQVTSPIEGRVSRNLVDPGNLVGESEATLLTTVTDYSPMYVYFNLNELDLLRVMEIYREKVKNAAPYDEESAVEQARIPLDLGLANEEGFPHEGVIDFADSGVDRGTGTIQLRGVFPNAEEPPVLIPGLFARVRMPVQDRAGALLVTERAISADQSGRYLLVLGEEDKVEKRNVRIGDLYDGLRVIEEGLRPDDRVVVNGIQKARPGGQVVPKEVDMASLRTSALRQAEASTEAPAEAPADETSDAPATATAD